MMSATERIVGVAITAKGAPGRTVELTVDFGSAPPDLREQLIAEMLVQVEKAIRSAVTE